MATPEMDYAKRRELGWQIYNTQIKPLVEPQENGKFLVVDVMTGAYAIGRDPIAIRNQVEAENPGAVCYHMRVGFPTPYRNVSMRIRRDKPASLAKG